jgi:hypothetical protein
MPKSRLINLYIFLVSIYLVIVAAFAFIDFELNKLNKGKNFSVNNLNISWRYLEYKWKNLRPIFFINGVLIKDNDYFVKIDKCYLTIDVLKTLQSSNWNFKSIHAVNMQLDINSYNNKQPVIYLNKYIHNFKIDHFIIKHRQLNVDLKDLIAKTHKDQIHMAYKVKKMHYMSYKLNNVDVKATFMINKLGFLPIELITKTFNRGYFGYENLKILNFHNHLSWKKNNITANLLFDVILNDKITIENNNVNLKGIYNRDNLQFVFNHKNTFGEIKNAKFLRKNSKNILHLAFIDAKILNKYLSLFNFKTINIFAGKITSSDLIWQDGLWNKWVVKLNINKLFFRYLDIKFNDFEAKLNYKDKDLKLMLYNNNKSTILLGQNKHQIKLTNPIYININKDLKKVYSHSLLYNGNKFNLRLDTQGKLLITAKKFLLDDLLALFKNYLSLDAVTKLKYLSGSLVNDIVLNAYYLTNKLTRIEVTIKELHEINKLKNLILNNVNIRYKDKLTFSGTGIIKNNKLDFFYDQFINLTYKGKIEDLIDWMNVNDLINYNNKAGLSGNVTAKLKFLTNKLRYSLYLENLAVKINNYNILNNIKGVLTGNNYNFHSKNITANSDNGLLHIDIKNKDRLLLLTIYGNKLNLNKWNNFCKKDCHFSGDFFAKASFIINWLSLDKPTINYELSSNLNGLSIYFSKWFTKSSNNPKKLFIQGKLINDKTNDFKLSLEDVLYVKKKDKRSNIIIGKNVPLYNFNVKYDSQIFMNLATVPDIFLRFINSNNKNILGNIMIDAFYDNLVLGDFKFNKSEVKIKNIKDFYDISINSKNMLASFKGEKKSWKAKIDFWKPERLASHNNFNNFKLFDHLDLTINRLIFPKGYISNIKANIANNADTYTISKLLIDDDYFMLTGDAIVNKEASIVAKLNSNNFKNLWFLDSYLKYIKSVAGEINFNLKSYDFNFNNLLHKLNGVINIDVNDGKIDIANNKLNKQIKTGKTIAMLSPDNIFNNLFVDDWNKNIFLFDRLQSNLIINGDKIDISSYITSSIADIHIAGDGDLSTQYLNLLLGIKPKISSSIPTIAALGFGAPIGAAALIIDKMFVEDNIKSSYFVLNGKIDSLNLKSANDNLGNKVAVVENVLGE